MGLLITVNGVDRTDKLVQGTLRYHGTMNGRDGLELAFQDVSTGFRPQDGQEIIVYPNNKGYRDEVLADGPQGYWRFEECVGTTAEDESPNNHDGIYNGSPSLCQPSTLGDTSVAVQFDGTDDFVQVADHADFDFATQCSLECWFSAPSFAHAFPRLIAKGAGDATGYQLLIDRDAGPKLTLQLEGVTPSSFASSATIPIGAWTHVVATYDGAFVRLYINGALDSETVAEGLVTVNATALFIGQRGDATARFNGLIDEVAVYQTVLSDARIAAHYAARTSPGRLFGGMLQEPEEEQRGRSDLLIHHCTAAEYGILCDRHLVARAYEDETLGAIVRHIVANDLAGEGIGVAGVEEGPVFGKVVFNYDYVTEAFNGLSEQSGLAWRINPNRVLEFRARGASVAPTAITQTLENWVALRVKASRARYRNKQYIRAGTALTNVRTEDFAGDGTRRTFVVGFPVGKVPTIQTNIGAGFVTRTVGINVVETGKDWYWNKNSHEIVQDSAGTVLTTAHTLRVQYQGLYPIVVAAQLDAEVASRAVIEGNTGVYEHVESRPNIDEDTLAQATAAALLERHGSIGRLVTVETLDPDYRAGQLVTFDIARHNLDGQLLIDSITAQEWLGLDQDGDSMLLFTLVAREGDAFGGWQEFFRRLQQHGRTFVIRDNEVIVLLRSAAEAVLASDVLTYIAGSGDATIDNAQVDFAGVA